MPFREKEFLILCLGSEEMLDEEVEFTHDRIPDLNKGIDSLLDLVGGGIVIAGTAAGYITANNWPFEFSKFFSFAIGAPAGFAISLGFDIKTRDMINSLKERYYGRKELKADERALEAGAKSVKFSYRGNDLECVIREEFINGHIFYMKTNDRIIIKPTFSYQPQREESLKFRFDIQKLKKKKHSVNELVEKRIEALLSSENPDKIIKEYVESLAVADNRNVEFAKRLADSISEYPKKMSENEKLIIKIEADGKTITTLLAYIGENYDSRLSLFSRCASTLMNEAYICRFYKQK